jgi:hypothetical protein
MKLTVKKIIKFSIWVSDYQTFGLSGLRTIGPSDYRTLGLSDSHLPHVYDIIVISYVVYFSTIGNLPLKINMHVLVCHIRK